MLILQSSSEAEIVFKYVLVYFNTISFKCVIDAHRFFGVKNTKMQSFDFRLFTSNSVIIVDSGLASFISVFVLVPNVRGQIRNKQIKTVVTIEVADWPVACAGYTMLAVVCWLDFSRRAEDVGNRSLQAGHRGHQSPTETWTHQDARRQTLEVYGMICVFHLPERRYIEFLTKFNKNIVCRLTS